MTWVLPPPVTDGPSVECGGISKRRVGCEHSATEEDLSVS